MARQNTPDPDKLSLAGSSVAAPGFTTGSSTKASGDPDFSGVTTGHSTVVGAGGGQSYTVKSGDSLSRIAKRVYGDAAQWKRIYEANRDQIDDPDLIHPGQTFSIP